MVLSRLRNWASQVGEIKIGEETDPTIALQLSGVDTEGILANAQAADNTGNRRRKIRELLFEQLGIEDRDELFLEHEITWRGTRRPFQVIFGNVRELTTESLTAKDDQRKAILDFAIPPRPAGRQTTWTKLQTPSGPILCRHLVPFCSAVDTRRRRP